MSNKFYFLEDLDSSQYTVSDITETCDKCGNTFKSITTSVGKRYRACVNCGNSWYEESYTKPLISTVLIGLYNGKNYTNDNDFIAKIFGCNPDEAKKIVQCFDINTLDSKTKLKLFSIAMRVRYSAQVDEIARYSARMLRDDLYSEVKRIVSSNEEASEDVIIAKSLIDALEKNDFKSIYSIANSIELPDYAEKNADNEEIKILEEQPKVAENHNKSRVRSLFFRRKNS